MPLGNPLDNFGMGAEYMSSALPWVTSSVFTNSPIRYDFPKVARFITVRNHGPAELCVGFTRNGVMGTNKFIIPPGQILDTELRVKELHLVALSTTTSGSVIAGLTTVDSRFMPALSGSITGSSGGTLGWDGVG